MKTLVLISLVVVFNVTISATNFIVNSMGNTNTGTDSTGTLLYCISQANLTNGPHTIRFSIAGTIIINSDSLALPSLTKEITIDATTVSGYNGIPLVKLDGRGYDETCLVILSNHCKIYGLDIINFHTGIGIGKANFFEIGATGKGNVLRNCHYCGIEIYSSSFGKIVENKIGTDPTGTSCAANEYVGIEMISFSNHNYILNNIISCNNYTGLELIDSSNFNIVKGNFIGQLTEGCVGNGYNGVSIIDSRDNIIGGTKSSEGNIIVGNEHVGVEIIGSGGISAINNLISGNIFSCNKTGAIGCYEGANTDIFPPIIIAATKSSITGTSVPNAIIEVYKDQFTNYNLNSNTELCYSFIHDTTEIPGQGTDYLGAVTADDAGNWTINGSFNGYITTTQRDVSNNTSPFANAVFTGIPGVLEFSCIKSDLLNADERINKTELNIYPNPTYDYINIKSSSQGELILFNVLGEKKGNWKISSGENKIHVVGLEKGIYFMNFLLDNKTLIQKIIIQ